MNPLDESVFLPSCCAFSLNEEGIRMMLLDIFLFSSPSLSFGCIQKQKGREKERGRKKKPRVLHRK